MLAHVPRDHVRKMDNSQKTIIWHDCDQRDQINGYIHYPVKVEVRVR